MALKPTLFGAFLGGLAVGCVITGIIITYTLFASQWGA